ncbi:hydrogenase 4 subunit D [Thermococcus sp. CX2]|uniref:hydrogenase 4 subunit D n=1 Tax=Thermococcus sp. CX2 TaxID=163006 RepID=UPI00143B3E76|nr:hydrogenase 4 subunit D [Thermococcus sp. CX2]NJE84531.1 hydrogenase 4 subunit D [Thermococcus sp. CX2]
MNFLHFNLSFLIPLLFGPFLVKLDGKKADAFMLAVISASFVENAIGVFEYLKVRGVHHIVYLKTSSIGEVYGVIIDPISVLIGIEVSIISVIFLLYAINYISEKNRLHPVYSGKGRFYAWMVILVGATLAFVYASSMLQMLIFFEMMNLACWGVVKYYGTKEAHMAAHKAFFVTNLGALIGLCLAVAIGVTKLHDLSLYALARLDSDTKLILFLCTMIAAFAKSAQFPLYSWLPDAMTAPTPASAFLNGAAMVEMGVFLLARIIQFMSPIPRTAFYVMLILVAITQILVIIYYPLQKDAKRLFAYSTIGMAGVMYVGLLYALLGHTDGLQAAIFQLFNHAFVKGLAFLSAGAFSYALGTLNMKKITGLRKIMPTVSVAWFLALVGLAGAPPLGLFFSKGYILMNGELVLSAALCWVPLILVLLDAVVFFIVAITWLRRMLYGEPSAEHVEIPYLMEATLVVLIILGIIAPWISYHFITSIGVAV